MKQSILIAYLFCSCFTGFAQNPLGKQWDKRFGGTHSEWLECFQKTRNGGYLLGGFTLSDSTGDVSQHTNGAADYWLMQTDSLGNKQWDKRFGGIKDENLQAIQETTDGGIIIGGFALSDSSGDVSQRTRGARDFWVVKMSSTHDIQWDKRYGGTNSDYLWALQQTYDGGYILGGFTDSDSSGDISEVTRGGLDCWMVKIDSLGNKQWDKRFGGNDNERLYFVHQTKDGGYTFAGWIESDSSAYVSEHSRGSYDYWLVKTDSVGNKIWDKRFGGTNVDYFYSAQQTNDGGYILGGISESDSSGDKTEHLLDSNTIFRPADFWLVKTDSLGIKQWDKKIGGTNTEDEFGSVVQTSDGGYLLAGTSYSSLPGGDKSEVNLGREQTWVIKTDSFGNKQWDKTIFSLSNPDDEIGFAVQAKGGCYAIANFTSADTGGYQTHRSIGGFDFWLIKFCDTTFQCNLSSPTVLANQNIFCPGDSVQVCATGSSGSYLWSTGETGACIYANHAGNYYVTVTDANSCSAVSNHLPVYVYPVPPVSITVNGNTLTSFNGITYQWYLNDIAINGAHDSVYVANQTGNYTVEISDSNGCHTFSNPVNVVVSGISPLSFGEGQGVRLFPNPASDQLFIESTEEIKGVKIYNTMGEEVMAAGSSIVNRPLSIVSLPCGVYIAEIKTKDGVVKKRWVKE